MPVAGPARDGLLLGALGAGVLVLLGASTGCGSRGLSPDGGLTGQAGTSGSNTAGAGGAHDLDAALPGSDGGGTGGANDADAASPGSDSGGTGGGNDVDAASAAPCAPPVDPQAPIELLSLTGCRDPRGFRWGFTPRAVPYGVNSPASDVKVLGGRRAFILPEGGKIHVKVCAVTPSDCPYGSADDGKWVFPVGTVVMQDVGLGLATLETRFLVRVADGSWVGYSYQWNQPQNEATLTPPDERIATVLATGEGSVSDVIPSRQDCVTCHNADGGWTLGLETAQLNLSDYDTGAQQLDRLAALGVFQVALPKPYKEALVAPDTDHISEPTTLDARTRSYFHTNCSFCHRPDGVYPSFDLRFDTPFATRAICNAPSQQTQLAGFNISPVILAPGNPNGSSLMQAGDWSHVLCPNAAAGGCAFFGESFFNGLGYGHSLLSLWIKSITSCP
jgi:hypothetical protein